jgi:hypothetical protein
MSSITPVPTSVYRYYDKAGVLLYVGITSRATTRQQEHNADKEWWAFVARQEVEHLDTRPLASERERELIRQFHPPFNKVHNNGWREVREAYLAAHHLLPDRQGEALSLTDAFHAAKGRIPLTQVERGQSSTFAAPALYRGLLLVAASATSDRVLLRAPRKRGVLTSYDLSGSVPTFTFTGERGGIGLIRETHLLLKVVSARPFVVRIHEAEGQAA